MLKKLSTLICLSLMLISFTSCNGIFADPVSLMKPPTAYGVLKGLEEALQNEIGTEYSYEYPANGEHRTAYILKDVDYNGINEGFVFYSLNNDSAVIRLNFLVRKNENWTSVFDIPLSGTGIERIGFADLTGDSSLEVLIGNKLYNTSENQLNIYTVSKNSLSIVAQEPYTQYTICNLINDDKDQLLLLNMKTEPFNQNNEASNLIFKNSATAKLLTLNFGQNSSPTILGTTNLDGNITAFSQILVGKLKDNKNAVYIDSIKGSDSTITDVLYFDKTLENIFFNEQIGETAITKREGLFNSRDINNDGKIEIPETLPFKGYDEQTPANKAYYIVWKQYDGNKFNRVESGVINLVDGYFLSASTEWLTQVTVVRNLAEKERIYSEWDFSNKTSGEELFRLKVFSKDKFQESNVGFEEISSDSRYTYAVKINKNNKDSQNFKDLIEIKEMFKLL